MRLLIWNIHKAIGGVDGRYAPARVVAVVRHYDPDVVLLQEVDDGCPRSGCDRQVDLLGDELVLPHRAFGPNVRLTKGCYGNATLSRWPILRTDNVDLQFGPKKPRGALLTELEVQEGEHRLRVHVVNVHLGLSGVERRWQARRLIATLGPLHVSRASRLVVAGDFNDWTGALPRLLGDDFGLRCVTGRGRFASRTFPAIGPMGALDRAFVRGEVECTHHVVSRLRLAREASDHLPLVVDLRLQRHAPRHRARKT